MFFNEALTHLLSHLCNISFLPQSQIPLFLSFLAILTPSLSEETRTPSEQDFLLYLSLCQLHSLQGCVFDECIKQ